MLGRAHRSRPTTPIVDPDETNGVARKLDAAERTNGSKTCWGFLDDVVAAVEAEYMACGV